jgi:hypothetical protein
VRLRFSTLSALPTGEVMFIYNDRANLWLKSWSCKLEVEAQLLMKSSASLVANIRLSDALIACLAQVCNQRFAVLVLPV